MKKLNLGVMRLYQVKTFLNQRQIESIPNALTQTLLMGCEDKADWAGEAKTLQGLGKTGAVVGAPCKVGKYEKRLVDLEKAMDESTLYDWYVTSVKQKDTPVWTGEHIEELLNDFYVIPKEAALEKRRCEADGD